jgi:intein/homing endonuclease
MRKCKACKQPFEPIYNSVQMVCSPKCSYEYAKQLNDKKWKKEKAKIKSDLMTLQDWIKIAQTHFNKYIRLRDKGQPCISCSKPAKKENAGHYRSAGGNPELRFEELNVHLQCEYCNTYKHGNLIEYRKNLINKIGLDKVEWLEKSHEPANYNIEEVKEIIKTYKDKCKQITNEKL